MTYVNETTTATITQSPASGSARAASPRARATSAARGIALAACLILLAAAPQAARAQATDFRWTTGQTNAYEVTPGATVSIPLYLQSITPAGASLLATENGLFSAGLSVRRSADGGAGGAGATITAIMANRPVFDSTDPAERIEDVTSPTLARLREERVQSNGSGSEPVGTSDRRVLVGFVGINGGDAGDVATYQIRDFVNAMDQISTASETNSGEGSELDLRIGVGTFTVNTVPEPSALGLLAVGAIAAVRRRRRA